ncbi:MAG: hypothetical protein LBR07_02395 [Puniceicoccales bacterium]|jgi:SpoVK/Ycf46/Vps4 family AAA+-type ATPase|nr:hypothetical protein [Puniceicoccales bacterium]
MRHSEWARKAVRRPPPAVLFAGPLPCDKTTLARSLPRAACFDMDKTGRRERTERNTGFGCPVDKNFTVKTGSR